MEDRATNATEAHPLVDISLGLDARGEASTEGVLHEVLHAIRTHLGMEVAFISEFEDERRIFRFVDEEEGAPHLETGASDLLEESYCQRVVDGRLPEVIHDARQEPAALELAATLEIPIGAYLSVPICLQDGSVYGTLCCFDRQSDATLNVRDLAMMRVFADFVARQLERQRERQQRQKAAEARIRDVLDHRRFHIVFQPMYDLVDKHIAGYEALSRFVAEPIRGPDKWFEEAATVGLRVELELAAIELALEALPEIPDTAYLSLNASPATILSGRIADLFAPYPRDRLMLEVTEHDIVDDYAGLFEALVEMRRQGLRLAIDDAGAGYASFRHILRLAPDVIKLDRSLTHGIDTRRDSRALAVALVGFATETGSGLLAEGVETQAELEVLRDIGVRKAQGYLLGRPGPLPA
ncbi:EAL domain-containing protein [Halomonas sp. DQ26W]|uniref:sensor domain-containing phosphodiesterase n=1 Tax=Halomonas sp. DQ26W TaxID=2282311 RepID=UPI000DF8264D|nr:EAL domain-containing protein [Halomonas sp. DQ26W]RDB41983.1 EAL domain-containing protein [Halomonas sp. DQ26W]